MITQRKGRIIWSLFLGLSVPFCLAALALIVDGLSDEIHVADVGVVLGNAVEGGQPSLRLKARLERALSLYNAGVFPYIIVSGGRGSEGWDEADVMRDFLIGNGVPKDRILSDHDGITTYFTARNVAGIMQARGWHSALVVSQYFHISRSKLAFHCFGISPTYSAHAFYFELRDIYSMPREVVGFCSYLFRRYS